MVLLYLIEIPHQTTTFGKGSWISEGCILSKFHIKPQLSWQNSYNPRCCILSKFHIKPQQRVRHKIGHSCCILSKFHIKPQLSRRSSDGCRVVSYRNSTSNHNVAGAGIIRGGLYLIEIPHQTTTASVVSSWTSELYLIEIPHQTTTVDYIIRSNNCCILSKFHIKPQPLR